MNAPVVDVIVPVYKGLAETRCALESVMAADGNPPFELVVINDASPEPDVTAWLREFARQDGVTLLENPENLGFVATVNRGMALHPDRDVVLLNSDTEVAGDWLQRLSACAHRHHRNGTVTPFSNNATICSYPRFGDENPMPRGWAVSALDALFAEANAGADIELPTAIGFCMYIRRDCLDDAGLFDVERFGKGYGEENEFCMRAAARGWKHRLAADCFVRHAGGVSFGNSRDARQQIARRTLLRMHPDYEQRVARFVREDTPAVFRRRVDLLRLARDQRPLVVHVVHAFGGGTLRHVEDIAESLGDRVISLVLEPVRSRMDRVRLRWKEPGEGLDVVVDPGPECRVLAELFRGLGVGRLHFHHLKGLPDSIRRLPAVLGVDYDVTLHDFFFYCPQIHLQDEANRYCGEPDLAGCEACLARRPVPGIPDVAAWRVVSAGFLAGADRVLAPSNAVISRMQRHFPDVTFTLAPHPEPGLALTAPVAATPLREDEPLRVLVLGALSEFKGADLLEDAARLAAETGQVSYTLVGFGYRPLRLHPETALVATGPYTHASLPGWFARLKPHVVWFPARVPETWSYTLSACLDAGLPVAVAEAGALPERIAGRPWSWSLPLSADGAEWQALFERVRREHFLTGVAPAAVAAEGTHSPTLFDYFADYARDMTPLPPALSDAELRHHADRVSAGGTDIVGALRQRFSVVAGRLGRESFPRSLARRLPAGIQARLRHWLLGAR